MDRGTIGNIPALFTSMSMVPNEATVSSTRFFTPSSDDTSVFIAFRLNLEFFTTTPASFLS